MDIKRNVQIKALVAAGLVILGFLVFTDLVSNLSAGHFAFSLAAYVLSAYLIRRVIVRQPPVFVESEWRIVPLVAAGLFIATLLAFPRYFSIQSGERAALIILEFGICTLLIWRFIPRK